MRDFKRQAFETETGDRVETLGEVIQRGGWLIFNNSYGAAKRGARRENAPGAVAAAGIWINNAV